MKELTIEDYPFYKLKIPSDRESLTTGIRKMTVYWEKLTTRSRDMSLGRLKSETISELKNHFKWNVSKVAAEIWLKWKSPKSTSRSSKKRSTKKRSTKKRKRSTKKRSTKKRSIKKRSIKKRSIKKRSIKKRSSKKRSSKKRSVRSRHSKTNSSLNDRRANRPSPSTSASSQKLGTTMKGNDENMYKVVKTVSGTRRWVKV